MRKDRPGSVQIKIAVVRQIHQGIRIGVGVVTDAESVVIRQLEQHLHFQISGIVLLAVRGEPPAQQAVALCRHVPELSVKAFSAPVQVILSVVLRQHIAFSVQGEFRFSDPVADPSDGCAEIIAVARVLFCAVIAEHNIRRLPFPVRDTERLHSRPVVKHRQRRPCPVGQLCRCHLSAVRKRSERVKLYCHLFSFFP